ncbi:TF29 [Hepatospora eriocheir]|uniref:TF29 n=1 Tax=Hepatospora eriocheir TaxID=1081669 RepID=A0A1X0QL09_9MICR|nr:TF29 [Hepatospora eriocheir]
MIGIYSTGLTKSERNYTVTEKEMLAIIKSLQHFRKIVYGSHVDVFTDHANLLYTSTDLDKRVYKWKLTLLDYDYQLIYKKGKDNQAADYLSRLNLIQESSQDIHSNSTSCILPKEGFKNSIILKSLI